MAGRRSITMTVALWEQWAEMSITHRDVRDADVVAVLRLIRREAELGDLHHEYDARRRPLAPFTVVT
jgi:hypothetical protein